MSTDLDFDLPADLDFDLPEELPSPAPKPDPLRPEAIRGRYQLPDPVTGQRKAWTRVTNFTGMFEDSYHLDRWTERNVAKGLAMRPDLVEAAAPLDVKGDKDELNRIVEKAKGAAGAYKMSDEGTALHKSTELADFAGWSLIDVPERHHPFVQRYLHGMRERGLRIIPEMTERVTVSQKYEVAGKFDRIVGLPDGTYCMADVKTGDTLEYSMPAISAQLECYVDGVNGTGVYDGNRYDRSLKVRTDFALVLHLPSTREEFEVYRIELDQGRRLNQVNRQIRLARRVKAKHVAEVFQPGLYGPSGDEQDQHWLERMNAAHTVAQFASLADEARSCGQWNERLAAQARLLAPELPQS